MNEPGERAPPDPLLLQKIYTFGVPKDKKIIVDLQGGLGNQLFCYSAGYFVAEKINFSLECRMTSEYNSIARDTLILSKLKLPGLFTTPKNKQFKIKSKFVDRALKKIAKILPVFLNFRNSAFYSSSMLGYDTKLENITDQIHLHGYFQTWKYPIAARQVISLALNKEIELSFYAKELLADMEAHKILVVHIRLGDYKNPENKFIGILHPDYYRNALARLKSESYTTYVFSDDIISAKQEYTSAFPEETVWVDEKNILSTLESLKLMSLGSAFIIANSTFSWWSAFLSDSPDQVIAPEKWFKNKEDPLDLYPLNWSTEESLWVN